MRTLAHALHANRSLRSLQLVSNMFMPAAATLLAAALEAQLDRHKRENLHAAFELFDTRGDGTVDAGDVDLVLASLGVHVSPDEMRSALRVAGVRRLGTVHVVDAERMLHAVLRRAAQ